MSGRTRRTLIARAFGDDFEYKTAGNYSVAAVIRYTADGQLTQRIAAVGNSEKSVASRAKTELRRACPRILPSDYPYLVSVVALTEATAPVVQKYFGTHRVAIDGLYRADLSDQDPMMKAGHATPAAAGYVQPHRAMAAGSSVIRRLAADGWTGVTFRLGHRSAQFTVAELLKSMNSRKKA